MKTTILSILLLALCVSLSAQSLRYDVMKGDKVIGTMDVLRTFNNDVETIEIASEIRYRVLIELVIIYTLNERFESGSLVSGGGYSTLNSRTQKEFNIEKTGYHYTLKYSDVPSRIDYESIEYTVAKIYYEEPEDRRPVFSQHFGRYLTFEEIEPNYYRMTSPEGKNYYRYENGICTEVTVNRDYGTIFFKLRPESYVIVNKPDSLRNK